jgi:Holliday junction resolvasome RuvABC endonuclease subunit
MATVVGIDPSLTSAGVAVLTDGQITSIEHFGFTGTNHPTWQFRSRRVRWVCAQVAAVLATHNVDLVVIEGIPEHGKILPSTLDRAGLWHGLYGVADHDDTPIAVMNPSTLKAWTTGSGSAKKAAMLAQVRGWFPAQRITCDDEADAIALALTGAFHLGDPMPFEVKPRHTTGLEKVAWP